MTYFKKRKNLFNKFTQFFLANLYTTETCIKSAFTCATKLSGLFHVKENEEEEKKTLILLTSKFKSASSRPSGFQPLNQTSERHSQTRHLSGRTIQRKLGSATPSRAKRFQPVPLVLVSGNEHFLITRWTSLLGGLFMCNPEIKLQHVIRFWRVEDYFLIFFSWISVFHQKGI